MMGYDAIDDLKAREDEAKYKSRSETDERLKTTITELRIIAGDMRLAIAETTQAYGPGVIVDYQLGKTGRDGTGADPAALGRAIELLDTLQRENARLKAPLTDEEHARMRKEFSDEATADWRDFDDDMRVAFNAVIARRAEGTSDMPKVR